MSLAHDPRNISAFDEFALEAESLLKSADVAINEFPTIDSVETADKYALLEKQMHDCLSRADVERMNERRPYNEELDRIQARWMGRMNPMSGVYDVIKRRLRNYLKEQEEERQRAIRKQRDEEQKLTEQAAEAQRAADEAVREATSGKAPGTNVGDALERAQALQAQLEETTRQGRALKETTKVGGNISVGGKRKAIALRSKWSAMITDWKVAAVYFRNDPKVQAAIQAAANAMVVKDHDVAIPGVDNIEEKT